MVSLSGQFNPKGNEFKTSLTNDGVAGEPPTIA